MAEQVIDVQLLWHDKLSRKVKQSYIEEGFQPLGDGMAYLFGLGAKAKLLHIVSDGKGCRLMKVG